MDYRTYSRRTVGALTAGAFALLVGVTSMAYGGLVLNQGPQYEISLGAVEESAAPAESSSPYVFQRRKNPARTEALDPEGNPVAVMTDGARTVHLYGPDRTFKERQFTNATVTTNVYVRLAPQQWREGAEREEWFTTWLPTALADPAPDVLATTMQYIYGARPVKDATGRQIGGDAAFGPLSATDPDGRAENSDFYDYLGVSWEFDDGKSEKPTASHLHSLDCSGFLRMVYGYRMGYPLRGTNTAGVGLPRRAYAIAALGPGVQLMPNRGVRAREFDRLMPGDMVFFNAGPVLGANIEHSGIFLGVDNRGHYRFISSRAQANGPTMGDLAGESTLDGTGYWALRWRTARRV